MVAAISQQAESDKGAMAAATLQHVAAGRLNPMEIIDNSMSTLSPKEGTGILEKVDQPAHGAESLERGHTHIHTHTHTVAVDDGHDTVNVWKHNGHLTIVGGHSDLPGNEDRDY